MVAVFVNRYEMVHYCQWVIFVRVGMDDVMMHQVDVLDLASCHWNPKSADPTLTWDQQNTQEWWEAFKSLNTMFADHMTKMLRSDLSCRT